jgi:IS5 family transposase
MWRLLIERTASTPWARRDRGHRVSYVGDQPSLWESILPAELLVLPAQLARADLLLDDSVFFAPFAPYFGARIGRPSIPMRTYLPLMF